MQRKITGNIKTSTYYASNKQNKKPKQKNERGQPNKKNQKNEKVFFYVITAKHNKIQKLNKLIIKTYCRFIGK